MTDTLSRRKVEAVHPLRWVHVRTGSAIALGIQRQHVLAHRIDGVVDPRTVTLCGRKLGAPRKIGRNSKPPLVTIHPRADIPRCATCVGALTLLDEANR